MREAGTRFASDLAGVAGSGHFEAAARAEWAWIESAQGGIQRS